MWAMRPSIVHSTSAIQKWTWVPSRWFDRYPDIDQQDNSATITEGSDMLMNVDGP